MNSIAASIGRVRRTGGFRMPGYRIWGSSVVRGDDGRCHMFASRVPASVRFHPGWMIASEIVRAVSDNPEGPYQFAEVVLPARGAQYWDGRSTHNPKIVKLGDRYALFYMGSTHPFEEVTETNKAQLTLDSKWCIAGRANKRVGVAVSNSVFGPWQRLDAPILPTRPGTFYSFLTSNPAPVADETGRIHLLFKSRRYNGNTHGDMMIGLARAAEVTGPYTVVNRDAIFSTETVGEIEDPCLWRDADGFHLLAKDQRGTITKTEPGNGVLAHSRDCLNWELDPEPLAYTKTVSWTDGSRSAVGNLERVSVLQDETGRISHLFFAVWEGTGGFVDESADATSWNMCVPLLPPA